MMNNSAFIEAHPELAERFLNKEGLDWIKKYTDYKDGKINECWERNAEGELVDVTAKYKAYEELEEAQEALAIINGIHCTLDRR